jgi:superoxide dismutase, Cu-Zn family
MRRFFPLVLLASCMTAPGEAPVATATLADAQGGAKGSAMVRAMGDGLHVDINVTGLAPGTYAAHIHTIGTCDAPDFMTAGGHWNPEGRQHGRNNPLGAHKGDLDNVTVGADGRGAVSGHVMGVTAAQLLDADGASVIVHKAADDYRTDPTGNAGGRQLCGVLRP